MNRNANNAALATKYVRWAFIQPGDRIMVEDTVLTIESRERPAGSGWTTFTFSNGQSSDVRGSWFAEKVEG